jgi:hypothetical protein
VEHVPWEHPALVVVEVAAADAFLTRLRERHAPFDCRTHAPARHARHLAQLWGVPLHAAGRATLLMADMRPVLALVPADRKISAQRIRPLLHAGDLRVLRGDRGVGRLGWRDLPGPPGALPAVPGVFAAASWVDTEVLEIPALVVALDGTRSLRLRPQDYVAACHSHVESFIGTTRLFA